MIRLQRVQQQQQYIYPIQVGSIQEQRRFEGNSLNLCSLVGQCVDAAGISSSYQVRPQPRPHSLKQALGQMQRVQASEHAKCVQSRTSLRAPNLCRSPINLVFHNKEELLRESFNIFDVSSRLSKSFIPRLKIDHPASNKYRSATPSSNHPTLATIHQPDPRRNVTPTLRREDPTRCSLNDSPFIASCHQAEGVLSKKNDRCVTQPDRNNVYAHKSPLRNYRVYKLSIERDL